MKLDFQHAVEWCTHLVGGAMSVVFAALRDQAVHSCTMGSGGSCLQVVLGSGVGACAQVALKGRTKRRQQGMEGWWISDRFVDEQSAARN